MRRPIAVSLISIAVLVSACSAFPGDGSESSTTEPDDADPSPSRCVRFTGNHSANIDTGSLATDALHLSGEAFACADDVVVVDQSDLNALAAASQLAAAVSGPLLFPEARLAAELGRLKPERVHLVGSPQVNVPSSADAVQHDIASALELAMETLGATSEVSLPAIPGASTIVETVLAISGGERVAVPRAPTPGSTVSNPGEIDESAIVEGLAGASVTSSVWMVDADEPDTILLAAAVGRSLGASVVAFDGNDILGYPALAETLDGTTSESRRFVGGAPEGAQWELAVLANGRQVPGGGFHILPEDTRRYLAYYGHPGTDDLGVLGEQGPAETLQKMQGFLQDYSADGAQVIPAFEIIASVASAGPTEDGDYSYEWPPEKFQPWIDFAAENDVYVVLDLQPGRDDFLSQAVQYEEFLRLPFVGLAFDPEWRLEPDQTHLNQIGSVTAAEINETVNWLADLVRDNGLPQKMVVLHQFRTSMIQNRQDVVDRPEIQLVVQMDGEGSEPQKDATWANLLAGAENAPWAWGWKNFFDEDEPGPPPPENVMDKEPTPVYVSYQ